MNQGISLDFIGRVSSPYKEKFAIPRQPGLVDSAKGAIHLINNANNIDLVRGLEEFSHIWVLFIFHGTQDKGWTPLVRPPRLGGNKKIGVLATRSTFRPNPVGMSLVTLDSIEVVKEKALQYVSLNISGLDLLDQTPVIDIKPYIPYSDANIDAIASYAQSSPQSNISVIFTDKAKLTLQNIENKYPYLTRFITQVLEQDPRPAYKHHKEDLKVYGMSLYDLNIQWKMASLTTIEVVNIETLT
jgi:tRNA-Thr(GGU) m(6)t(6)A37 methyltransferase TsaA